MVRRALLFDSTMCIGCEACVGACKDANRLPAAVDKQLTARTWTVVEQHEGAFIRRLCMHCETPTCASVCPVGAFRKDPAGPVRYDADRCIGCRYCIMACPFSVPKYQWDRVVPFVQKCTLCADRVTAGGVTACAEACPTGATRFGERPALIREAQARIAAEPSKYVGGLYGVEEVGGTDVLLLAAVPFQRLGIRPARHEPLPLLTWRVLSRVPDFGLVAGTLLYGISWITHRRIKLEAERARDAKSSRPEA